MVQPGTSQNCEINLIVYIPDSIDIVAEINRYLLSNFNSAAYIHRHWHVSSQYLSLLIGFLLFWGIISSILPGQVLGSSSIMRLIFLIMGGDVFGKVLLFFGLPDILGMIGFGIFYRNIGWGEFEGLEKLESFLR